MSFRTTAPHLKALHGELDIVLPLGGEAGLHRRSTSGVSEVGTRALGPTAGAPVPDSQTPRPALLPQPAAQLSTLREAAPACCCQAAVSCRASWPEADLDCWEACTKAAARAARRPARVCATRLPRPDGGDCFEAQTVHRSERTWGEVEGAAGGGERGGPRGKLGLRQAASDREARQGTSGLSSGLGSHSNIRSLNFIVDTSVHVI